VAGHDRHVRYCKTRTRHRPRSCYACNVAKTKCSFGTPCARCAKKRIGCAYLGPSVSQAREATELSAAVMLSAGRQSTTARKGPPAPLSAGAAQFMDPRMTQTETIPPASDVSVFDAQTPDTYEGFDLSNCDIEFPSFTDALAGCSPPSKDFMFANQPPLSCTNLAMNLAIVSYEKPAHQLDDWCAWTRHGVSLAVVTESARTRVDSGRQVDRFPSRKSHAECNADLIIQSWRAFPTMMLRRETFPFFIHPQSPRPVVVEGTSSLPEAISNCMAISQMFASSTDETKPILWRNIELEYRRLVDDVCISLPSTYPRLNVIKDTFHVET
jgi:hypothetical protein